MTPPRLPPERPALLGLSSNRLATLAGQPKKKVNHARFAVRL